ncbi:MAG TPA: hypothetical protein DD490_14100 [Acidobacteria bacterium]|nr:hypothetical protein [Acidobacteriota bacterium]
MIYFRFTSDFCLYQGQELATLLHEAEEEGDRLGGRTPLEKLHSVAEELRSAGEILAHVELRVDEEPGITQIELADFLKQRWYSGLANHLRLPVTALQVVGSCSARVPRAKAETAISQILYWLGRRLTRYPSKEQEPQVILCKLEEMAETARIVFEEHLSRRMPKQMRDALFVPFTPLPAPPGEELEEESLKGRRLGLFLAKIVVETVGGSLEEDSDAIPGGFGHRFVLQLPSAPRA